METSIKIGMEFSIDVAWQAGKIIMRYFGTGVSPDWKTDNSPVTIADREAEELIRKLILNSFPDDGLIGEEFGNKESNSGYTWLIDPIDGTKSFVQGVPLFGVLLARQGPDGVDLGCVYMPALDEMIWAGRGHGCWWDGRRARVSDVSKLEDSCICFTSSLSFAQNSRKDEWEKLSKASRLVRGWGDCYGHILVATGRAEASFDPVMNPWDCGPLLPIMEEAQGTFTDWNGKATVDGKDAFSTNGHIFEEVIGLIGH
ncbi:MAG: inositol monophosphatase family protein [Candidatus Latescibacterota bacterium]|nr:inositol monophosphatase family protein [Candidatus Latescibacterota bacterium]